MGTDLEVLEDVLKRKLGSLLIGLILGRQLKIPVVEYERQLTMLVIQFRRGGNDYSYRSCKVKKCQRYCGEYTMAGADQAVLEYFPTANCKSTPVLDEST
jgi:hypothetical protein